MTEPRNNPGVDHAATLAAKLGDQSAVVGVIGLGYVGLPLVQAFVAAGFRVMGFDVDPAKIERLKKGESYIGHIPSSWIARYVQEGRFVPTADMSRLGAADAILICVPTPLNDSRDPDLSYVESTTRSVAETLRPGQLVVLESTTYPGTTRDVVAPLLSRPGLALGQEVFLAYSPEREDPGNPEHTARKIPKVVGGIEPRSAELAAHLYAYVTPQVVPVSNCEVAEACKILENTYRAVNIALVNELKMLYDRIGVDVWEVIEAAKTKPFGFQAFYPGPGLGGHCIPIDPFYLTWLARKNGAATRFIELAGEINSQMPNYVVERVTLALNERGQAVKGSKICILGVAYKKDVDDPRESPSFELLSLLRSRGAILTYSDPHIPRLPKMRHWDLPEMESQTLSSEFLASQNLILIATAHSAFDFESIVRHAKLIVDTRNATRGLAADPSRIRRA